MLIFQDKRKFAQYTVIIEPHAFEMSNDPNHIVGVNRCIGHSNISTKKRGLQVEFNALPARVQEAIKLREYIP